MSGNSIDCDATLKALFEDKGAFRTHAHISFVSCQNSHHLTRLASFTLTELPGLIRKHLSPAPPLEVEYTVRVSGQPRDSMQCWDIQVQDAVGTTLVKSLATGGSARANEEIQELEKEISATVEQMVVATKRHRAFDAMARDPVQVPHAVMGSLMLTGLFCGFSFCRR